jgi:hypothetical protein
MTFQVDIFPEIQLDRIKHLDAFTIEDIQNSFREAFDNPKFETGFNFLRDCRDASLPEEWTFSRMVHITTPMMVENVPKMRRCKIAWLVKSKLDYGIINQVRLILETQTPEIDRRPFYTLENAYTFLGVPEVQRPDL